MQPHRDVGIVLRRRLREEVAPYEDDARVGVEPHPVAGALVGAEDQLEVAVGVDLELPVVAIRQDRSVDAACGIRAMDRERDVRLATARTGDPVRAVAADQRLVVDRVGVVAEELARRRDDRGEARSLRISFEEQLGALGEQVEDVAEPLDGVELVRLALWGEHVVVAHVGEQPDEFVERLGGLRCERHQVSRQIAVGWWGS